MVGVTGIVVTNDGNAILRELDIAHPAAKVLYSPFHGSALVSCFCFFILFSSGLLMGDLTMGLFVSLQNVASRKS